MAVRSSSRWLMGIGSRPSRGPTCCATASAAACAPRCWRSVTERYGSGALREIFPQAQAKEQRCWFHKIANCPGALPKSAHHGAKKALAEIWNAEDKTHALAAAKEFEASYGVVGLSCDHLL
jgi:hypothetical protein